MMAFGTEKSGFLFVLSHGIFAAMAFRFYVKYTHLGLSFGRLERIS